MKKFLVSLLSLVLVATQLRAGTGDISLVVRNADGTYSEIPVAFTANGVLSFGSTAGTVTSNTGLASAAAIPSMRAGTVAMANLATKAVTFTTPFANGTTYVVTVITNGLATSGYAASQTTAGFTLILPLAVTGNISYIATPVQ